jgi:hypothetical protein
MRFQAQRTIPNMGPSIAFTPCASDAEFLEKLRYLYAQQANVGWDLPDNGDDYGCIVIAAACHFCPVNA